MLHIKLAQFAVLCALPPRRSESPVCATDNKPSCMLHLLGWFIGSRGFSSLERRPEFWVLQYDSVRLHRRQPTRLPRPWDSPGKNTGVGCHFLLQCMKVESEREVAQSCPTLSDPMDCSLPGSSVHGIFQARVLDWAAIAFFIYFLLGIAN